MGAKNDGCLQRLGAEEALVSKYLNLLYQNGKRIWQMTGS